LVARPPSLAPKSNSLSGAPSAVNVSGTDESRFFDQLVKPEDLSAVFQPIVSLDTGELFAYEALVRCRIPNFTPPVLFEHAAAMQATGRLGRMIREIAVPLCSGIPLFVNLHPTELEESWLVRPDDPVFFHDDDIYLEVTESAPMTHLTLCTNVLREVCGRAGVHLVIDDLGAGYSNLNLIADLEPRVVKLDRKLVQDLHRKPRQQKVVEMVVRLCEDLGASVVAEGIETVEEFKAVCASGAQYGQGYLFARPAFPVPPIYWPNRPAKKSEPPPPTRPQGSARH
jgi:EAL domain-containing protein (putative c-di-GMP-specific phosphodiesterase class I)